MSKIYTSADQLVGHTPLLELTHVEASNNLEAKILAKLEYFNPAGSVKDPSSSSRLRVTPVSVLLPSLPPAVTASSS